MLNMTPAELQAMNADSLEWAAGLLETVGCEQVNGGLALSILLGTGVALGSLCKAYAASELGRQAVEGSGTGADALLRVVLQLVEDAYRDNPLNVSLQVERIETETVQ